MFKQANIGSSGVNRENGCFANAFGGLTWAKEQQGFLNCVI